MWQINIEKIDNGYIITNPAQTEEDVDIKIVIEEDSCNEQKTVSKLLYQIAEHFGFHYNKWEKDNLKISWDKKGDNYEKPVLTKD